MDTNEFKINLEFGEDGEKEIGEMMIKSGWLVQPLYQYNNKDKAPYIFYEDCKIIAPDMICYKPKQQIFVECKRKHQWVRDWNFIGNIETGLNNNHFLEYKKIFDLTEIPLRIYFIHDNDEPGIYYLEINSENSDIIMQQPIRRISEMTKNNKHITMSFFQKNFLIDVNKQESEVEQLLKQKPKVVSKIKLPGDIEQTYDDWFK